MKESKQGNLQRLDTLYRLPYGWDGVNAPSLDESVIEKARTIVVRCQKQPVIQPQRDGSLSLLFGKGDILKIKKGAFLWFRQGEDPCIVKEEELDALLASYF